LGAGIRRPGPPLNLNHALRQILWAGARARAAEGPRASAKPQNLLRKGPIIDATGVRANAKGREEWSALGGVSRGGGASGAYRHGHSLERTACPI
jgi:hypothetical protein